MKKMRSIENVARAILREGGIKLGTPGQAHFADRARQMAAEDAFWDGVRRTAVAVPATMMQQFATDQTGTRHGQWRDDVPPADERAQGSDRSQRWPFSKRRLACTTGRTEDANSKRRPLQQSAIFAYGELPAEHEPQPPGPIHFDHLRHGFRLTLDASVVKNFSVIFVTTPAIKRDPSCASFPPIWASTSYDSTVLSAPVARR